MLPGMPRVRTLCALATPGTVRATATIAAGSRRAASAKYARFVRKTPIPAHAMNPAMPMAANTSTTARPALTSPTEASTPSVTSWSELVCRASLRKKALPSSSPRRRSQRATLMFTSSVPTSTTNASAPIWGGAAATPRSRSMPPRATSYAIPSSDSPTSPAASTSNLWCP